MINAIGRNNRAFINAIASDLYNHFNNGLKTDLVSIANEEAINLYLDDYGTYFDGMLVWDNPNFHIHLNTAKGNSLTSKKGRFTLAHEFGHYFIDSHRIGLKNGNFIPHPSIAGLVQSEKMETEADYFASCLLMPRDSLRSLTSKRKFSFDVIKDIAEKFDVSLIAAAIRFAEVGTHDIMVVFCEGNKAKWFCKSDDFPDLAHRFNVGGELPPTTVIGESFLKNDAQYTTVEEVDLEDWFYWKRGAPEWQLYEQCFYSDIYDYAISIVWFE